MKPSIKSIMFLREALTTGVFDIVRLSTLTVSTDFVDSVLEFAEDEVSRMNEVRKALDALPERPSEQDLIALHEAILLCVTRQSEV